MKRGHIVLVELDPTRGREQAGRRPCLVVSADVIAQHQRFPLLAIVPLTSTKLSGPIYPSLAPDPDAGVRVRSSLLLDQVRTIDKSRIAAAAKQPIAAAVLAEVERGLRLLLGLA